MKALVAGATGPVGEAVVARLLAEGHEVAIVTRRPFLAERLFGDRIAIHEWHPLGEPLPRAAAKDCDAVLSLMGAPLAGGRARDREALAVASRVKAIRRLAEATAARDVRLVVASLAVAPAGAGPQFGEAQARDAEQTAVGRLVAAWEAEAEALHGTGRNVATVRLGLVGSETGLLGELTRLARHGVVPSLKGALIPAIAAEDVAAMLAGLLQQRAIVGLVHGVAPTPVKGEAVMAALRALSPLPWPLVLPLGLLRRRLGLALALLGNQRQIVPDVLTQAGANFTVGDPTGHIARAIASHAGSRATRWPPPEPPIAPARLVPDTTPTAAGEPLALTRQP